MCEMSEYLVWYTKTYTSKTCLKSISLYPETGYKFSFWLVRLLKDENGIIYFADNYYNYSKRRYLIRTVLNDCVKLNKYKIL
jgi:hypothetical protein